MRTWEGWLSYQLLSILCKNKMPFVDCFNFVLPKVLTTGCAARSYFIAENLNVGHWLLHNNAMSCYCPGEFVDVPLILYVFYLKWEDSGTHTVVFYNKWNSPVSINKLHTKCSTYFCLFASDPTDDMHTQFLLLVLVCHKKYLGKERETLVSKRPK